MLKRQQHIDNESSHKKHRKHASSKIDHSIQFNSRVVKVMGAFFTPNYAAPWNSPLSQEAIGSATVINKKEGLLLTCAHVGDPQSAVLWVRLGNDSTEYQAEILFDEPDCDLALLKVSHPDFIQKAEQVELGEFQPIGKHIIVAGYPCIGNELNVGVGKISSNEMHSYVHGNAHCLASSVTAPINGGNSGGGVFDRSGKLIGVAFQSIDPGQAEAGGYIIPMPVIQQFLTNAYAAIARGIPSTGVPALPIKVQLLENAAARQYFGMRDNHSGLLVTKIDDLAKNDGLLVDDVILELDGHKINNDATVSTDIIARVNYAYLVSKKQMGENITMRIMRQKKELLLNIPLKYRSNELKIAGRKEFTMHPTYYIKNGVCFQPLTQNYMYCGQATELLLMRDENHENILARLKQQDNHQLIVINRIFNSELTHGYTDVGGCDTVVTINGVKIMNMHDVVNAMESNKKDHHCIGLENNKKIVLRVATTEEELQIATTYQIKQTHSNDLTAVIQAAANQTAGISSSNNFLPNYANLRGSPPVPNPIYKPAQFKF